MGSLAAAEARALTDDELLKRNREFATSGEMGSVTAAELAELLDRFEKLLAPLRGGVSQPSRRYERKPHNHDGKCWLCTANKLEGTENKLDRCVVCGHEDHPGLGCWAVHYYDEHDRTPVCTGPCWRSYMANVHKKQAAIEEERAEADLYETLRRWGNLRPSCSSPRPRT